MVARLCLVSLLVVACKKEDPGASSKEETPTAVEEVAKPSEDATPAKKPTVAKVVPPSPANMAKLAADAQVQAPKLQAFMERSLTNEDIDRFLAIRKELAPHRAMLRDPAKRAEYATVAEPVYKKHGLSGATEHAALQARIQAATMAVKYKVPDDKLDPIKKGDRDVVKARAADLAP